MPEEFIARALAPAEALKTIITSAEEKNCTVVVPNDQLSLAIGKAGQNAKLAAKLTGYKIDIKPQFDSITGEAAPELSDDFKIAEKVIEEVSEVEENTDTEISAEEVIEENQIEESATEEIAETAENTEETAENEEQPEEESDADSAEE